MVVRSLYILFNVFFLRGNNRLLIAICISGTKESNISHCLLSLSVQRLHSALLLVDWKWIGESKIIHVYFHRLASDICQPNEIQCANRGNGRKCVQKFWMCDGDRWVLMRRRSFRKTSSANVFSDCDDGSDEQQHYCGKLIDEAEKENENSLDASCNRVASSSTLL